VTGTNFVASSEVRWNGVARPTTVVSGTQLQAGITGADIATAGSAQVTVVTPAPGGGTSAPALTFTITSQEVGLVAYWPLNEGTGTLANDVSGHGYAGTLINGPAWTAGKLGLALAFDGLNDYVEVPHALALNAYPLTVATWIKTTSATGVRGIVNKYLGGSFNGWSLFLNNGRLCAWYVRSPSDYVSNGSGCPFSLAGYNDGQWHHVVYVVDAFAGRIYVDGVLKALLAWTGTRGPVSTTQPLHLGRYPGAAGEAEYFPGLLDDVRIYGRALSGSEISALYANGAAGSSP
jgi:hypothetical protein